jgi:hypothetical protein
MRREGEISNDGERRVMTVGSVGCPISKDLAVVESKKEDLTMIELKNENSTMVEMKVERNELECGITQTQGESRYCKVCVRRKKRDKRVMPICHLCQVSCPCLLRLLRYLHHPPQTQNTQVM